jgi:hypothetical protein
MPVQIAFEPDVYPSAWPQLGETKRARLFWNNGCDFSCLFEEAQDF